MQANDESGLSGSLNLGHYGVTQTNSFESVKVGGQGAELVTPFAKLQLPYQVYLKPLEGIRKGCAAEVPVVFTLEKTAAV